MTSGMTVFQKVSTSEFVLEVVDVGLSWWKHFTFSHETKEFKNVNLIINSLYWGNTAL